MPRSGYPALHGVNPNKKKAVVLATLGKLVVILKLGLRNISKRIRSLVILKSTLHHNML